MKRASNQIRVTAPEQDERLRQIADALVRSGVPDAFADIQAEGYVNRLRRKVFESLDDVIGSGDDLEALVGWKGPPRCLAIALFKAQYVREINSVYVMTDAVTEAPEYIKQRWRRRSKAGYDAARRRASKPNVIHQGDELFAKEDDTLPTENDGAVARAVAGEKNDVSPRPPGHKDVVAHWDESYKRLCNPAGYVWTDGRDFGQIKKLIDTTKDVHRICRAIDRYHRCREAFYAGWPFYKFFRDFVRFDAEAAPRIAGELKGKPTASSAFL